MRPILIAYSPVPDKRKAGRGDPRPALPRDLVSASYTSARILSAVSITPSNAPGIG
jgi:hypothetical protein